MSAEAIARLREYVEHQDKQPKTAHVRWVDPDFPPPTVKDDDLRALLDAHAALETAHAEALDALVGALHVLRESDAADVWQEETDAVKAVLAKAGRR